MFSTPFGNLVRVSRAMIQRRQSAAASWMYGMPHIARSVYDEQCCSVRVTTMRQTTLSVAVVMVVVVVEKSGNKPRTSANPDPPTHSPRRHFHPAGAAQSRESSARFCDTEWWRGSPVRAFRSMEVELCVSGVRARRSARSTSCGRITRLICRAYALMAALTMPLFDSFMV